MKVEEGMKLRFLFSFFVLHPPKALDFSTVCMMGGEKKKKDN